jgi:hypothetical protein
MMISTISTPDDFASYRPAFAADAGGAGIGGGWRLMGLRLVGLI